MRERRRVGAIHSEFIFEIGRLLRLDAQNQQRFRAGPGPTSRAALSANQINLITEGIFLRGFSLYEEFLEEIFIFYSRGRVTRSGIVIESFLRPKNSSHARDMVKSHMTFLEWNSPETIIQRCDIYLRDGGPIKVALTTNLTRLGYMRRIRNAIVHRSQEAFDRYATVVRSELRVMPLEIPNPGEFLLSTDPRARSTYFLISYLDVLKNIADTSAG